MAAMACVCVCEQRHCSKRWALRSIVAANVCVALSCECYPTRQTDMSGKTYHIGVTNVEDLTPESFTIGSHSKFCPTGDSNSL